MKKVLYITSWYPHDKNPNSGVFIRDQAEIASIEHQVVVFFANVDWDTFSLFKYTYVTSDFKGIREYRLMQNRSVFLLSQIFFFCTSLWHLSKIVRDFKPDIIQANVSYPSGFIALVMSKAFGIPYIVVEHTRITNHFRNFIIKYITVLSLKKASYCFAVGSRLVGEIASLINKNVFPLPNVIDTERFKRIPKQTKDIVQIGFLGALNTPVKGLDILLKALAEIKSEFVLHVGGTGLLMPQYKELARELGVFEKCIFYGFVPHSEVPSFMSRLHFFVSASRYETFGIVIVEALASGRPAIATRCGGPEDYIDQNNGILVPPENVDELTKAIELMIDSYSSYDSEEIKLQITKLYSKVEFQNRINSIYEKVFKS